MNNENVRTLRRLFNIFTILGIVTFSGCASAPEKKEVVTEPVAETAKTSPLAEESSAPAVGMKAAPIVLAERHPTRYVVVKGDTLWGISEKFLRDPWRWPEVWQGNQQVANPHLIYPGDVLVLMLVNGRPVIRPEGIATTAPAEGKAPPPAPISRVPVNSTGRPIDVVKLSPHIREIDLEKAIPTIPEDAIAQFLERSVVIENGELSRAPYVVDFADEHTAGGGGYRVYVRRIKNGELGGTYMVVKPGKEYRDPDTGERLGQEASYRANATIDRLGDPATLTLENGKREVLKGDRLIPGKANTFNHNFMPHAPINEVKGRIISVFDAVNQIGTHQVVVINLGKREGMEPGDVLAIYRDGHRVTDTVAGGSVKLPDERSGIMMVFRTFDKVSYALVLRATRAIHLKDRVVNP